MAAGAFNVAVPAGATVIVALPPAGRTGNIKFGQVFLSLASDFGGAEVRLAIGKPGAFRLEEHLRVDTGRKVTRDIRAGDEIASIVSRGRQPVAVLVEYEGL
jgi:hypothetical protein